MKCITISRQYGSGGHDIGTAVAKRLGLEIYDHDIMRRAAREGGYDLEYIERSAERISQAETILDRIMPVLSHDHKADLFELQKSIILDFVSKGPCVIVGRCADSILQKNGHESLRVFIYADRRFRAKRLSERHGIKKNVGSQTQDGQSRP